MPPSCVALLAATTPTTPLGDFVRELFGADSLLAWLVNSLLGVIAIAAFASGIAVLLVWMERKVSARFQLRLGPTRAGWHGLLQPVADGIKLLLKTPLRPGAVDGFTYRLAPFLPMMTALLVLGVIPFSASLQLADPELGIIYVAALSGLSVLGILLGSWGSNNKYSLLGGLRAGAQSLSYEVSLLLVFLSVVLLSGSTSLQDIVASQGAADGGSAGFWQWWIIKAPGIGLIAFVLFMVTATAELHRCPFDIAEAESELAGGYHTEYSGMPFAMFFLAEYVHLFIAAALGATFFLGGYLAPHPGLEFVPGLVWMLFKTFGLVFVFMWFRWTFPRLRIDQLMSLEWKCIAPVALLNLLAAGALVGSGWLS